VLSKRTHHGDTEAQRKAASARSVLPRRFLVGLLPLRALCRLRAVKTAWKTRLRPPGPQVSLVFLNVSVMLTCRISASRDDSREPRPLRRRYPGPVPSSSSAASALPGFDFALVFLHVSAMLTCRIFASRDDSREPRPLRRRYPGPIPLRILLRVRAPWL
jgi:hypothetical protein